jgi:hypothetical protein
LIRAHVGRLLVPLDIEGLRSIDFASQEDYFIYLALTGNYSTLADAYEQLKGKKMGTKLYRHYRAQNQRAMDIMLNTKLTDGTRLLDAIKGKINL